MRKIKFLFIVVGLFFTSALLNETNATTSVVTKKTFKKDNKTKRDKKPDIVILYLYASCPDGTLVCVGNFGFMDNGTPLGYYYWGIGNLCDGHGTPIEI